MADHSPNPSSLTAAPIQPGVRIGHVHLKVADLDGALAFYCGVLGFELMQRYGSEAAFISAAGITTISASTLGKAAADRRRRWARPACSISQFCIRAGRHWPTRCGV
jgi:catechol 2,3-dioxygenase-like lactoylglutathione lyase family enzyme